MTPSEKLLFKSMIHTDVADGLGCWHWLAPLQGAQRPRFSTSSGRKAAHVLAYSLASGPVPPGLVLRNICGDRRCVRPEHHLPLPRIDNISGTTLTAVRWHMFQCIEGQEQWLHERRTGDTRFSCDVVRAWQSCATCNQGGRLSASETRRAA